MITVNAMGDACPIPVVKTKKAISALMEDTCVEVLVDNEIAVQNLQKMAKQLGFKSESEMLGKGSFRVQIDAKASIPAQAVEQVPEVCKLGSGTVVVIDSETMGEGDDVLGRKLLQGFIFALSQRDTMPNTILLYNGGAKVSAGDGDSVQDLIAMQEAGVEILTCGTCLNHYGLTDKLKVGTVTNMYEIVERMSNASKIIRP